MRNHEFKDATFWVNGEQLDVVSGEIQWDEVLAAVSIGEGRSFGLRDWQWKLTGPYVVVEPQTGQPPPDRAIFLGE